MACDFWSTVERREMLSSSNTAISLACDKLRAHGCSWFRAVPINGGVLIAVEGWIERLHDEGPPPKALADLPAGKQIT